MKKVLALFLFFSLLLSSLCLASAQDASFNVAYNVGYGGLLWVNGTSIINATTVTYLNNTQLLLAATPTNANYSYASMDLNDTITTENPTTYTLLTNSTDNSNCTVTVNFVAEAIPTPTPTPDPDALTIDDSVAIAVIFGLISIAVCLAFILQKKG
jgi:hypothetical protein